jgi:hypothetical protein
MKPPELKLVRLGIEQGILGDSRKFGYDVNKLYHITLTENKELKAANAIMQEELEKLKKAGKWAGWPKQDKKEGEHGKD